VNTREIEQLAHDLMAEHGLTALGWRFKWDNSKNRGGQCRFNKREIGLSKPIFSLPQNQHGARNTILHEIAHALAGPSAGHGPQWRRQARAIGCTAERCHTLEVIFKYLGSCGCGEVHKRQRLPRMYSGGPIMTLICRRCRQDVTWRMNGQR
jgi:predicted SprT family Zn-dependent metalloprotease